VLVLIDESGCPGFKLATGSTACFVLAMVRFMDFTEAEQASRAIGDARERLGVKPEFKFNKCKNDMRDAFFDAVEPFQFNVRAIVVEKNKIHSYHLRSRADQFYNFFVRCMLTHGSLKGARIKIDGSGGRKFKQAMNSYLRRMLAPEEIHSFKFVNSRSDNLVQLADMCAGAIARSYRASYRSNANRWQRRLSPKIENIWPFR
jgi:hypothetical protein